jgi:hypothetical protein
MSSTWIIIISCLLGSIVVGAALFAICAVGAYANPNPRADD